MRGRGSLRSPEGISGPQASRAPMAPTTPPCPSPTAIHPLLSPSVTLAAMCESSKSSDPKQPKAPRPSASSTSGVTQEAEQQDATVPQLPSPAPPPWPCSCICDASAWARPAATRLRSHPRGGQVKVRGCGGAAGSLAAKRHSPTRREVGWPRAQPPHFAGPGARDPAQTHQGVSAAG